MATGITVSSVEVLGSAGSSSVAGATVEAYDDSPTWFDLDAPSVSPGTEVLPVPATVAGIGILIPSHGGDWFERIHVLPRVQDLGAVGSLQEFEVEVYNAYRGLARFLAAIDITGAGGVTVVDHLGLPAHYPALRSELYVVQVPAEGDPLIDSLVTWDFDDEVSPGRSDARILGYRMIPWAFEPNSEEPIRERWGFATDIIESQNGNEQRRQLRAIPWGSIGLSYLLTEAREVQEAQAILYGNQARPFGVPRWPYKAQLLAPASAGSLELLIDPTNLPFAAGGICMVWTGPRTLEVHTIAEVQADRLVLAVALSQSWATGAKVVPLAIGRLSTEETLSWLSLSKGELELIFSIDRFQA